jgi:hypothetical protein
MAGVSMILNMCILISARHDQNKILIGIGSNSSLDNDRDQRRQKSVPNIGGIYQISNKFGYVKQDGHTYNSKIERSVIANLSIFFKPLLPRIFEVR